MKIIARFIGKDSLGYIHGQTYILTIKRFSISRNDGTGKCLYATINTFLANWTDIKHL